MHSSTNTVYSIRILSAYSTILRWRMTASTFALQTCSVSTDNAANPCSCSKVFVLGDCHWATCEIRDSDWGDRVRKSSAVSVRDSFITGMLISSAVSHKSRISSTMRIKGRRTANDRPRLCPILEVDCSLDRGGVAGAELEPDATPDDGAELAGDAEPIGSPLYSGWGPKRAAVAAAAGGESPSPVNGRLCRSSRLSSTFTMAWRCSLRFSWAIWTSISDRCSCRQRSECFSNHQGVIWRSQTRHKTGSGAGCLEGSGSFAAASARVVK